MKYDLEVRDRREQGDVHREVLELTQATATTALFRPHQTGGAPAGAAVAASAALGGPAQAGERGPAFSGGRHGLRDLTYELTTSFPTFAPGEEAVRRTLVTIENDGYYLQEWRIIEHVGTHVDAPGHFTRAAAWRPS